MLAVNTGGGGGRRKEEERERDLIFPEPSPFSPPPPSPRLCQQQSPALSDAPHPDSPFCTGTLLSGKRPSTYNASLCLGNNTHYTEEQQESWRRWVGDTDFGQGSFNSCRVFVG